MSTTEQQPNQNTNDTQTGEVKHPLRVFLTAIFAFLIPIGALILVLEYATGDMRRGSTERKLTHEAVVERIQPVARVAFEAPEDDGELELKTGEEVYNSTCATCHAEGVSCAPKYGDADAWAPYIDEGYDEMLEVALNGRGAMPAKGGNNSLDDLEVERAMVYMANAAGADFDEPDVEGDAADDDQADAADEQDDAAAADEGDEATDNGDDAADGDQADAGDEDEDAAAAGDGDEATDNGDDAADEDQADAADEQDDAAAADEGDEAADNGDDAADGDQADAAENGDDADASADTAAADGDEFAATDEQLEIGQKLYDSNCFACHAAGVAGAPKVGDADAWAPYTDTGLETMLEVAIKGTGAMPPRGGSTASDEELEAAILYMLSENE